MNATGAPAARESRLGAVGLVALLVASLILGLYVYRARTPDLALEVTNFPQTFEDDTVSIDFFVRFDEPEATVEIVGRDQVIVKTLDSALPLESEETVRCVWDGTTDDGETVPPGRYRLRVALPSEDREMVFPRRIKVKAGDGLDENVSNLASEPCAGEAGE